ncbi:hypothetical protein L3Q82_014570 [Scortum barcoo]|uniref:Uncharacterized protein n=1 Tax=Scortum barcoo TaxID=214431 RepID=A0ACB8VXB8_9TELE|nr:hypothetical protein L3Q82_014570 [Scortum barcoo]
MFSLHFLVSVLLTSLSSAAVILPKPNISMNPVPGPGEVPWVILPKPNISMNPVGEVPWGQKVDITCSILTQHLGGTFILKKNSDSFRSSQTSNSSSATFSIPFVDFDNEGSYQCQYQYQSRVSSQNFSSPFSDSVRLSVTVSLQQPTITLTSPNRGLVWSPEGAEVTKGYSFVFTCSIHSNYPAGRFFLIFSGSNITDTNPAVNHSASFNFPVAEYERQGEYSCVYEVTLSSRKFTSPETTSISVIITCKQAEFHFIYLPVLLLTSSIAAGILLLLLLILVVVCLVFRRRRQASQPGAFVQTQLTVMNHLEDSEDDEKNEEQLYVNYESAHSTKKWGQQTRAMEEQESDDSHDYEEEENNGSVYVENNEMYVTVEDNGKEELNEQNVAKEVAKEEESSDTDDDYVNVQ